MIEDDAETLGVSDANALGATPEETSGDDTDSPALTDEPTATHERKLTRENASLRRRLREIEAKETERAQADLSETERLTMQLAETTQHLAERETRIRTLALSGQIATAAQRFGIIDTDAATKLVDTTSIEYDDDAAQWVGVDDALRALALDRPWLTQTGQPVASSANPTNPTRRRSTLTVEQLRVMSQSEIDALSQDEINAALANGK